MANPAYIPPHDIYKTALIRQREEIIELMKTIDFYLGLKRVDVKAIKNLKAAVKNFYRNLRPKMILYMENGKLYDYKETISYMDYFLIHGNEFGLAWCMEMVNQLFAFCEEHGITSLTPITSSRGEDSLT